MCCKLGPVTLKKKQATFENRKRGKGRDPNYVQLSGLITAANIDVLDRSSIGSQERSLKENL